jgi:uncharacterized protein
VIFVGDATMSPYEITHPGGSVEHYNEESGMAWLGRVSQIFSNLVRLNPTPGKYWPYSASTDLIRRLVADRMYPLTLHGLDQAMRELTR